MAGLSTLVHVRLAAHHGGVRLKSDITGELQRRTANATFEDIANIHIHCGTHTVHPNPMVKNT